MNQRTADPIWESIRVEVQEAVRQEPMLANFFYGVVLNHRTLEDALTFLLASKLESTTITAISLRDLLVEAYENDRRIGESVRRDLDAVKTRDPACRGYSTPFLYFKGFHAIQSYRAAHYFWEHEHRSLALFLQSRISQVFAVDIHPAAKIGSGILIDHATGVVIGETAVVEDDVSMLHEVTLGGTGKEQGNRHPKIRRGVLIGAGTKILGNIEIGEGAKIGASSVVLDSIPPHSTAVGVPAKVVGEPSEYLPALGMDHMIVYGHGEGI